MQIAQENATASASLGLGVSEASNAPRNPYSDYKIIRRNGAVVGFEPSKISVAMTKAFLAVNGSQGAGSARIREVVAGLTEAVVGALLRRQPAGGTFHIEDIQDQVELALMRSGEHDVARSYVLYREERVEGPRRREGRQARCARRRAGHPRGRERPEKAARRARRCCARWRRPARACPARRPSRSSRRRCATSTTACRWTKCASPRCWRRGR